MAPRGLALTSRNRFFQNEPNAAASSRNSPTCVERGTFVISFLPRMGRNASGTRTRRLGVLSSIQRTYFISDFTRHRLTAVAICGVPIVDSHRAAQVADFLEFGDSAGLDPLTHRSDGGCKAHRAIHSSRKQPEQAWRRRNV